jgi:medium-chain acyl-[acyl-carrier-protein] hydrolase
MIKAYNTTPQEVLESSELMAILLPGIRADFEVEFSHSSLAHVQALELFRGPSHIFPFPVFAYGGMKDSSHPRPSLEAWGPLSSTFTIRMFPGGHFFLHDHENLFFPIFISDIQSILHASTPLK